jgi:hypothetical protein
MLLPFLGVGITGAVKATGRGDFKLELEFIYIQLILHGPKLRI